MTKDEKIKIISNCKRELEDEILNSESKIEIYQKGHIYPTRLIKKIKVLEKRMIKIDNALNKLGVEL